MNTFKLTVEQKQELQEVLREASEQFLSSIAPETPEEEQARRATEQENLSAAISQALADGDWDAIDKLSKQLEKLAPAAKIEKMDFAPTVQRSEEYEQLSAELAGLVKKGSLGKTDADRLQKISERLNELDPAVTL